MSAVTNAVRPIDLTDISLFTQRREHDAFAYLRDHDPVHRNPALAVVTTTH